MNERQPPTDAELGTILRCLVGSKVHGLNVSDQDDRDEMGVCIEPWAHFFGLREPFEQVVWRTQPEGARSGPGDLDLVVYSLAKWARLALSGNPTILLLLFVPEEAILFESLEGRALRDLRSAFIGESLFEPYLGYMRQQRVRLTNRVKMPNRPELIARYGFDTKYAGHLIRIGLQGIELATTGALSLPMRPEHREHIISIRTGKVPESAVLEQAAELEARLVALQESGTLPQVDRDRVESFVIDCYRRRSAFT